MFTMHNVYNKFNTIARAELDGQTVDFIISSIISKRNKEELDENIQFVILNSYLDYKGYEFKKILMDKLLSAAATMDDMLVAPEIYPLPYSAVTDILDLFDLNDVFYYLKHIFKLQPPTNLADVWDPLIESDSKGTRVQTYLKEDYLELAAVCTILKVGLMPCYNLAYNRQKELSSVYKEYILYHLFKKHPIMTTPPIVKVKGLIQKLIEQSSSSDEQNDAKRVLEKSIPKDDILDYVLSLSIFQKLAISPLVDDDFNKNVVTKVYNFVNNKLQVSKDLTGAIRAKSTRKNTDGSDGDSESVVESHRIVTDRSQGEVIEMNWVIDSLDKVIAQLPPKQRELVTLKEAQNIRHIIAKLPPVHILKTQVILVSTIFKSIMDPRCIDYIELENLYNLFAVGYVYMWNMGYRHLAIILASTVDLNVDEDTIYLNSTVNKSRLSKELKDELDVIFPYKRVINSDTQINLAEEAIGEMVDELYRCRLISLVPKDVMDEAIGGTTMAHIVTSDIKIMLANFIVQNERRIYNV